MGETGALLQGLIGRWRGTASTWLRPEAAPLTGEISGSFSSLLDGDSVLYEYTSKVGEHRSDGIVLTQDAKGDELSFIGSYTAGEETWGWQVVFGPVRNDELVIEHFRSASRFYCVAPVDLPAVGGQAMQAGASIS